MSLNEFDIIEQFFKRPARHSDVQLSIGDDAALITVKANQQQVQCIDTMVANQHFLPDCAPYAIGYKALAINLSDIAAMGAQPQSALLALTLPDNDPEWLSQFSQGFFACADAFEVDLIGGDTTAGPLTISVSITATVKAGTALQRAGAKPDDDLYVTGTVGGAAYALKQLQQGATITNALRQCLEQPTPRVAVGQALIGIATACIDLSDGLAADTHKLLLASGVGATIVAPTLPINPLLQQLQPYQSALQHAINGGDDYELCFSAPPQQAAKIEHIRQQVSCPITKIGNINPTSSLMIVDQQGNSIQLATEGYDHFSRS